MSTLLLPSRLAELDEALPGVAGDLVMAVGEVKARVGVMAVGRVGSSTSRRSKTSRRPWPPTCQIRDGRVSTRGRRRV